jgi:hypothetical protein
MTPVTGFVAFGEWVRYPRITSWDTYTHCETALAKPYHGNEPISGCYRLLCQDYLDPFGQEEEGKSDQHSNRWRQGQKKEHFGNKPEDMHGWILAVT